MTPVKVFFSYSHKDEILRDEFSTHLSSLKRKNLISEWHDRTISAGDEWAKAIDDNLINSQVVLLLVSSDFIASDYCFDIEMKAAMKMHEEGQATVIPIILRPCDWRDAPFSKLQALPKDGKPITTWTSRDEAWLYVEQKIQDACKGFGDKKKGESIYNHEKTNAQKLLKEYLEIENNRHGTIRFPLLSDQGVPLSRQTETFHVDIPLYLTYKRASSHQITLDVEGYNEIHRESFTSNYLNDRASHEDTIIGDVSKTHKVYDFIDLETRLIVVGDPGCGKTTLVSKLAYFYSKNYLQSFYLVEEKLSTNISEENPTSTYLWIPILLMCRDLLDIHISNGIEGMISNQLRRLGYDDEKSLLLSDLLVEKLNSGEAILLIDGLDEIPGTRARQEFSEFISKKAKTTKAPIILTSRVVGFRSVMDILSDAFDFANVAPLSMKDKKNFILNWSHLTSNTPELLINELTPLVCYSRKIAKLCETIFLLVLVVQMRISFGAIPEQKKDVYRRAIELMIARHHKLQNTNELSINEIWPYLEFLAYKMRLDGAQKWTDTQVLGAIEELRELEVGEPEAHRYSPTVWLNNVIYGVGLLNIAGSSIDNKGFERPVIQFFHQSFQEYFAAQAVYHGRGKTDKTEDSTIQFIKETLENSLITERKVEQLGDGQITEPVAAGQWQEVIRNLISELVNADDAICVILPVESDNFKHKRALTVLALQCLAEEPNVKNETAILVFEKISGLLTNIDGYNTIKNTLMDEAIHSVTKSSFGSMLRQTLLNNFIQEKDLNQRRRVGRELSSSWGIANFGPKELSEIQEFAQKALPDLNKSLKFNSLLDQVDAGTKITEIFYWLQTKKDTQPLHFLSESLLKDILNTLYDVLQTQPHDALLSVLLWSMVWLTNARASPSNPLISLNAKQHNAIKKILSDTSLDYHTRADAATLLCTYPKEQMVCNQYDWIYEWAVIADGGKEHKNLPSYTKLYRDDDVEAIRTFLNASVPIHVKSLAAIAMGRLGYFEEIIIEPLMYLFMDGIRSSAERDEALIYLVFTQNTKVLQKFMQIAREKNNEMNKYNISERALLGIIGYGDAQSLVEQLSFGNKDPQSLDAYAYALAGINSLKGIEALTDLKTNDNKDVKNSAIKALKKSQEWQDQKSKQK